MIRDLNRGWLLAWGVMIGAPSLLVFLLYWLFDREATRDGQFGMIAFMFSLPCSIILAEGVSRAGHNVKSNPSRARWMLGLSGALVVLICIAGIQFFASDTPFTLDKLLGLFMAPHILVPLLFGVAAIVSAFFIGSAQDAGSGNGQAHV